MSATAAAIKAALLALTNENTRKKIGWVLVAILSPVILIVALICSIFSSTSQQNVSTVELCFHGGTISSEVAPEYRAGEFQHAGQHGGGDQQLAGRWGKP